VYRTGLQHPEWARGSIPVSQEKDVPLRLTSDEAWKKAAACAKQAEDSFDDETRILFERLRDRWITLAQRLEFEDG
jgi:hypothetical protein